MQTHKLPTRASLGFPACSSSFSFITHGCGFVIYPLFKKADSMRSGKCLSSVSNPLSCAPRIICANGWFVNPQCWRAYAFLHGSPARPKPGVLQSECLLRNTWEERTGSSLPASFTKGLHRLSKTRASCMAMLLSNCLASDGCSQHLNGSGYQESIVILTTLEDFWKHFQNLGAPRGRQCVIALGPRAYRSSPRCGHAPGLHAPEDRRTFWSAADLKQGIS